jgi:uncharacterized membrane protein
MTRTNMIAAFVAVLAAGAYAQQPYTFVNLEPGGTAGSNALAATQDNVVYGYTTQPAEFFTRAARWSGDSMTHQDITPAGFNSAVVLGVQRGAGSEALALGSGDAIVVPPRREALVWHADGSAVVITPVGFNNAFVAGGSASGLAGHARPEGNMFNHAFFWTGPSADQAIDLHPAGYQETFATSGDGDTQVGYGRLVGQSQNHAYLWHGTAASAVDLTPTGITAGFALSIDGNQIGGYIKTAGLLRAVIWDAQTYEMTNLHYENHESSISFVSNGRQVGRRTNTLGIDQATLWIGTPESATDLNVFLPHNYINSVANWINDDGTRIVGAAFNTTTAQYEAVMWQAQEPMPGDTTGDGFVSVNDLLAVINAWGTCPAPGSCAADLNGDGIVNVDDLLIVINNWS